MLASPLLCPALCIYTRRRHCVTNIAWGVGNEGKRRFWSDFFCSPLLIFLGLQNTPTFVLGQAAHLNARSTDEQLLMMLLCPLVSRRTNNVVTATMDCYDPTLVSFLFLLNAALAAAANSVAQQTYIYTSLPLFFLCAEIRRRNWLNRLDRIVQLDMMMNQFPEIGYGQNIGQINRPAGVRLIARVRLLLLKSRGIDYRTR